MNIFGAYALASKTFSLEHAACRYQFRERYAESISQPTPTLYDDGRVMMVATSTCAMRANTTNATSTSSRSTNAYVSRHTNTARTSPRVAPQRYNGISRCLRTSTIITRASKDDGRRVKGRPPIDGERVPGEDDLYYGTYSNFFTDPAQIKGVVIFCAFLASFFSLGNIGAAVILPILYGVDSNLSDFCLQSLIFGYYCK